LYILEDNINSSDNYYDSYLGFIMDT